MNCIESKFYLNAVLFESGEYDCLIDVDKQNKKKKLSVKKI